MASVLQEVSENNFTLEIGPSRYRLCSFTISAKVTHQKANKINKWVFLQLLKDTGGKIKEHSAGIIITN